MKFVVRLITLCAALLLLVGMTGGRAWAQNPDPQFDSAFANVPKLEKPNTANPEQTDVYLEKINQVYDAFIKIRNDNNDKNKELAADAVLRASLFAYDGLRNMPATASLDETQKRIQDKWVEEGKKVHEFLRKLSDGTDFPGTRAAQTVNQPLWVNGLNHKETGLREALESELDRRSSGELQYRIIDSLVKMTGEIPGFSYWFALFLIAVIVKALTFPLMLSTYKSQREMQKVAPLMKEIQEKYKGKPELNEKMMAFYKEHKINPFASCLPLFIQLPFLWWVFNAIRLYEYHFAYGKFLWIGSSLAAHYPTYLATDLAKFDMALLLIYAASNYLTMRLTPAADPSQAQQQKTMAFMMTAMMIFIFLQSRWSAAFIFYWLVQNFISAIQSYYLVYKPNKAKLAGLGPGMGGNPPMGGSTTGGPTGGKPSSGSSAALSTPRPATVTPGGETARPRPKRRGGKR